MKHLFTALEVAVAQGVGGTGKQVDGVGGTG
jgi:hypothetical protein